jgi:hypothetical protein
MRSNATQAFRANVRDGQSALPNFNILKFGN